MNKNLWLLAAAQGLFLTNNVVFIAINGLVGLSLAPAGWMATLPVMVLAVGTALVLYPAPYVWRTFVWMDADVDDRLRFPAREVAARTGATELPAAPAPERVRAAVEGYFGGDVRALDGLAVTTGGTDFQRTVWKALRAIPAGETRTYGQLAAAIEKAPAETPASPESKPEQPAA